MHWSACCAKQRSEPTSDKRGAKVDELRLTQLELIDRIYEVFPLLWEGCDAQMDDGSQIEQDWGLAAQPAHDYCVDQHINWWPAQPAVLNRCWMALRSVHAAHITLLNTKPWW